MATVRGITAERVLELVSQQNAAAILPSGSSLNTVVEPSTWIVFGSNYTNMPVQETGILSTYKLSANAGMQVWVTYTSGAMYQRFRGTSGYSSWKRIDGGDRLPTGVINNGEDLDNYRTPGLYGYWSGAINNPNPNASGMLLVANMGNENSVIQIAFEYGSSYQVWSRFRGSFWAGWRLVSGNASGSAISSSASAALKTAAVALSTPTGAVTETVAVGTVRFPFKVNAPIKRWRLHVRNYNDRADVKYMSGANFGGLYLGDHAGGGAFTAAPTQVLPAFTLPSDGSEYVSPWVNDSLGDNVEKLLSLNWLNASGPNVRTPAGCYRHVANRAAQVASTDFTKSAWAPFSWWVEVQTDADVPVVAMMGDSITTGTGNDLPIFDSPLAVFCRRIGAIPSHYSYPGTGMVEWTNKDSSEWKRYPGLSPVDAVLQFMGQNDLAGAGTLSAMQQRFNDTIQHLKANVSPNVYLATITPSSTKSVELNTVRKSYNAWLKTLPGGAIDCFDFSTAVQNANNDALLPAFDSGDALHLSSAGSQALADSITRPVVSTRVFKDLKELNLASLSAHTQGTFYAHRDGNIVTLSALDVAYNASGTVILVYLPLGYRPPFWQSFKTVKTFSAQGEYVCRIKNGGLLEIYAYDGKPTSFQLSYPTKDPMP